jgi:hypothetical protein
MQEMMTKDRLVEVIRSFWESYKITGRVKILFSARNTPDSDLNTVVDVYLQPLNREAETKMDGKKQLHMQFLSETVPPELMAYAYTALIEEVKLQNGTDFRVTFETEAIAPNPEKHNLVL